VKIVTAIKQVPDTETKIAIASGGTGIDESNINWILNPYDEFAVEEALKIRDAAGEGEVIVVTVGPDRVTSALRTCLAMGADRAMHLDDPAFEGCDALGIARIIAAAVERLSPDLILAGQYAVGTDNRQVGMMLAGLLDMPHVSVVTKLEVTGRTLKAHREVEGGAENVECTLPCVITAQKGLNEPRYASLKGIMAAKKKPIEKKSAADLGLDAATIGAKGARVAMTKLELPPPKPAGRLFKDDVAAAVKEVARLLHEEAKVI